MDADCKGSGESARLQGLPRLSFLDTAMGTSAKSMIYSLLLVAIYLAWFEISTGLIECIFIYLYKINLILTFMHEWIIKVLTLNI